MADLSLKGFPDELYQHLKLTALQSRKTLRDYIIDALRDASGGPNADAAEPNPPVAKKRATQRKN